MRKSSKFKVQSLKLKKEVAFLWDESFLWGVMAYKALKSNGLPFDLIRSEDIKRGQLKNYKMLFVPGGWASNKLKTLVDDGTSEIRKFVSNGGNYLGFCGGAGLSTLDGIGLLNVRRKPTKERVPSFSGRIYLNVNDHPIWERSKIQNSKFTSKNSELQTPNSKLVFHAWWPSQFLVEDKRIKILATYGDAMPDSFSSDLNVGDVEANGGWSELEDIYKINLDPKRLKDEPAVIEGTFGKGKVLLSLIHFDSPDDENGAAVLRNLWGHPAPPFNSPLTKGGHREDTEPRANKFGANSKLIDELETAVNDLINLGIRNFLWFWRNSMFLQWRRGVRGLEYCTLYVMVKEIAKILKRENTERRIQNTDLNRISELLMPFVEKAKQLLILERLVMQNGHITYEKCDDPEIQKIRTDLFSRSKSHGGLFKRLIDRVDALLYTLIRQERLREV